MRKGAKTFINAIKQIHLMKLNKINIIKLLLYGASFSYIIGAIAHFFGLTLFPWYVSALYSPYHDSLIPLIAITVAILVFGIAKNLDKNPELLNVIITAGIVAIIYSSLVLLRFDYAAIGIPEKSLQTIVETASLVVFVIILILLKPKKIKS